MRWPPWCLMVPEFLVFSFYFYFYFLIRDQMVWRTFGNTIGEFLSDFFFSLSLLMTRHDEE